MPLEINRDIDNDAKGTFMAKGILFTVILLVVAVPILLGTIMIRSFFKDPTPSVPSGISIGWNAKDHLAYTLCHINERPVALVWEWRETSDRLGIPPHEAGSEGIKKFISGNQSPNGTDPQWTCTCADSLDGTFQANDQTFNLKEGRVFLIKDDEGTIHVKQLSLPEIDTLPRLDHEALEKTVVTIKQKYPEIYRFLGKKLLDSE